MEEQHAPSDSFVVFLIASFFPYVVRLVLLCLVFGSMCLDSYDHCERVRVSKTTTTARPKESPQLSAGKKEISALKGDPFLDRERFASLWCREDVAACAQEDDGRDVGSDEEETSEGGSEHEIEEMEDEVSDSNDEDEDDNHDEEDYDDDDDNNEDDNDDDDDEDDGWEVLERRQLRREYERAVRFVEASQKNDEGMSKLSDDEKLRFYGLHKVAVEGPCQEPQPAPFNLSARAKWNAWRRLGFMSPDDAVEQYIDLLQEKFPNWRKDSLIVSTAGDRDPKRLVEARSESSLRTVDHCSSQARIGSICSLLSFVKLVMNKLGEISFRRTKMSGEGCQSSESAIRHP